MKRHFDVVPTIQSVFSGQNSRVGDYTSSNVLIDIETLEPSELNFRGQRRPESEAPETLDSLWPKVVKVSLQDVLEAPQPPRLFLWWSTQAETLQYWCMLSLGWTARPWDQPPTLEFWPQPPWPAFSWCVSWLPLSVPQFPHSDLQLPLTPRCANPNCALRRSGGHTQKVLHKYPDLGGLFKNGDAARAGCGVV